MVILPGRKGPIAHHDHTHFIGQTHHARRFTDSMPAADVWITLRTAKHRSKDSVWRPNDIFDIDALAVAAAYCDVVVTERHSAHVLRQGGIPEHHGTTILTGLDELTVHLDRAA